MIREFVVGTRVLWPIYIVVAMSIAGIALTLAGHHPSYGTGVTGAGYAIALSLAYYDKWRRRRSI